MTTSRADFVTDVRSIRAVVGLVETRGKWGIIDRIQEGVMANFAEEEHSGDPEGDEDIM
ncbi:hypothetical protein JVT61DRAFT_13450 [Boletus reticuloceps]|uniref:Uncharacterized protein n=1 Tax=Boletus reticuloceps TaxID=495285 RepID=A0A8I2YDC5_9AGAM|nr:hypothetical protein JVT61DRAFT_13450 [Boletus reticuloceps]